MRRFSSLFKLSFVMLVIFLLIFIYLFYIFSCFFVRNEEKCFTVFAVFFCGKPFVDYGKNLYPVMGNGRCCDDCNMLVVEMYWWLYWNHDILKGRVDNLLHNRYTTDFICICLNSVAFTIYKDESTKKLDITIIQ